ncbi:MAG: hypothetical protein LBD84_01120 [Campylobacteraceae bacterium]|nr:hypothetical protein [Campylobacteraceae bacterium]
MVKKVSVYSDTAKIGISISPVSTHYISFYDENLTFIKATVKKEGTVDISGSWYKADENSSSSIHNLTKDINLYALPSAKETTSQEELDSIRDNLNGNYILLKDIALDG